MEVKDPRVKGVALTSVDLSRDLSVARVYFGLLDPAEDREAALEGLERATGFLRSRLGKILKVRHVPELRFAVDDSAEEGVRLTLRGLQHASNQRERRTALANLCAGYILLEELETALTYCDRALEQNDSNWRAYSNRALAYVKLQRYDDAERDLQRAEALAPNSRKVKTVRAMLLDATDPVAPQIVIDDRRQPADDDVD